MGGCLGRSNAVTISSILGRKSKRLTREQRQLVKEYLPSFPYYEVSTEEHLKIAGAHWNSVFRDVGSAKSKNSGNSSSRTQGQNSSSNTQSGSRMGLLYDVFNQYLEKEAPELKHVFRASMHVKSKVLLHISAGMRSLLTSANFIDKVLELTKTHIRFGVQLEYFDALGMALIKSMKDCSGTQWTPEVENAWKRLYAHCSAMLLQEHRKMTEPEDPKKGGRDKHKTDIERAKRLPKEYIPLVEKYLPNFNYKFASSEENRKIAADHWNSVFRESAQDTKPKAKAANTPPVSPAKNQKAGTQKAGPSMPTGPSATSTASSSAGANGAVVNKPAKQQSNGSSRLAQLYDVFYDYLHKNSPELKDVFRSSMHVRSKVLVHISAGMRTLLVAGNINDKVAPLVKTHFRFGVKLEHFDPLGLALLHAMKEVSGKEWSVEIENAWSRLFGHCSAILIYHQHKAAEQRQKNKQNDQGLVPGTSSPTSAAITQSAGPTVAGIKFKKK